MKKLFPARNLLLLAFISLPVLAQEVDLDDITMTVVGDGVFEARQLARPDIDAIREFMEANAGSKPEAFGKPAPAMQALLEDLRLAKEAGDTESLDTLRGRMDSFLGESGMPFPDQLPRDIDRDQMQRDRPLFEHHDIETLEQMRDQREQLRGDGGERPTPFPDAE